MKVTLKRAKNDNLLALSAALEGCLCEVVRSPYFPVGAIMCVGVNEAILLGRPRSGSDDRKVHDDTLVRPLTKGDTLVVEE